VADILTEIRGEIRPKELRVSSKKNINKPAGENGCLELRTTESN